MSHSHRLTHEGPEAQVWELPRCTEEQASSRAQGDTWPWHLEYSVQFGLGKAQDTRQGELKLSSHMKVWKVGWEVGERRIWV